MVAIKLGRIEVSSHGVYEQGVAMLSGIVNSKKAVAMNIAIMRAIYNG